jgi:predicted MFS family arabinose efflux permease
VPAAAESIRSGPPELRQATAALAITQLISWGVLYYAFAVVAPAMARQPGWGVTAVSGAFSVGLLVSGLSARAVAAMLGRLGPRVTMTAGSLLAIVATTLWASASSVAMLYAAWALIGAAMAATLYEPAIVVLALLDSGRMRRTITAVTVAGGLASTVFVPLTQYLVETLDWRAAVAVLGCGGGAVTAALHARHLPRHVSVQPETPTSPRALTRSRAMRRLRLAYLLEQASAVAASALVVTMLIDRGVDPRAAGFVLASSGVGKVAGRVVLAGRIGRASPELLAAGAAALHAIAVVSMLASAATPWLYLAGVACGAASGTSSVLRPLIVARHVPLHSFAAANARLQGWVTAARALGPLIVGGTAAHTGWTGAWAVVVGGLTTAAGAFAALPKPAGNARCMRLGHCCASRLCSTPSSGRRLGLRLSVFRAAECRTGHAC